MKAYPLPRVAPSRLPRPVVTTATVQQPVTLRPYGNTIALTTLSENPFTGARPISVRTQASGGMAPPDPRMQSRRLYHSYLPGLGEDAVPPVAAPPAKPAGVLDFLTTAAGSASSLLAAKEQAKIAAAQAAAAQAQARSNALLAQFAPQQTVANMARHKSITIPLLIVGGVAVLGVGFLLLRKRKAA